MMIVYGDPKFEERASRLLHRLRRYLEAVNLQDLDSLRTLLIRSGQVEQAVVDRLSVFNHPQIKAVQGITDHAASAFYAALQESFSGLAPPRLAIKESLNLMSLELNRLAELNDSPLVVKVPEGYEFYTLYPEQYCASANQWLQHNPLPTNNRAALVIGIRSIGTSLSALVAVTLSAAGWQTTRTTVRPSGHPFQRIASLNIRSDAAWRRALVVDEGPGISGSSFFAVAKALLTNGFDSAEISFLPGHEGEPGPAASPETRARWITTDRHVVRLENLRWHGRSLAELLINQSNAACQSDRCFNQIDDLSAGAWRAKVCPSEECWPPVCMPFEKTKYLCRSPTGAGILWKFSGLGSMDEGPNFSDDRLADQSSHPYKTRSHPLPMRFHGFQARPWVTGKPLTPGFARDSLALSVIERAIIAGAHPPLTPEAQADATHRLSEMLFHNTKEAFNEMAAQRAHTWVHSVQNLPNLPKCGEGRLEPHHWIQTLDGSIVKTGTSKRLTNHTVVGSQPILWEIAGMMVEWNLNVCPVNLRSLTPGSLTSDSSPALKFYRLAYAAFRMGQTLLCAGLCTSNPGEKARLNAASEFYRNRLGVELGIKARRA